MDQGLEAARKFIHGVVLIEDNLPINGELREASKPLLNEYLQRASKTFPVYKVVKQEGPDHSKMYVVAVYSAGGELLGNGKGKSKHEAEEDAAEML